MTIRKSAVIKNGQISSIPVADSLDPGTAVVFSSGITPSINQAQATSGAGAAFSINAQQGFTGNIGGICKIGGGSGATPGTNLAGATQIDLGAPVANVSALLSILSNSSSIFDIKQGDATSVYLKNNLSFIRFRSTYHSFEDASGNVYFNVNVSGGNNEAVFQGVGIFANNISPAIFRIVPFGNTGSSNGLTLSLIGQSGQTQTGSNANTNGGNLYIYSGAAGTGGSGAAGTDGYIGLHIGLTEAANINFTTGLQLFTNKITFGQYNGNIIASSGPQIQQFDNTSSGGTGENMFITAQKCTGGGGSVGGDLVLSPGTGNTNGIINLNNLTTGSSTPSSGGAGALPANPAGYVTIKINGSSQKIAYY